MKITIRYCPTCRKETIQAKRKNNYGEVSKPVWYCPCCSLYNKDKKTEKIIENTEVGYIT